MINKIIKTENSTALLILRLTLGLVILPHGLQKTFGMFGGYGFTGTMGFFTEQLHIPAIFAFLAIAAEFAGALGLITGLLSRVAALGIGATMLVAIFMGHFENGFFMNWFGNQKGEGFEYHLLAIGIAIVIMIKGSGAFSIDRLISSKKSE